MWPNHIYWSNPKWKTSFFVQWRAMFKSTVGMEFDINKAINLFMNTFLYSLP